jgi:phosphohistidine phosphatase
MRHAKSSWKDSEVPDQERDLNKRGEKDAPRMGKLVKKEGHKPDLVISSPAVRARRTAELIAEKLDYEHPITFVDALYLGEPEDYMTVIKNLPDEVDTALVIGHNPGLETLLQLLSGKVESLPTGAIAVLHLPVKVWSALSTEVEAKLLHLWRPKEL